MESHSLKANLISTDDFAELVASPPDNLKVLDASWHYRADKNNGPELYAAGHIPGAQYFDISAIAVKDDELVATWPTNEIFQEAAGRLGLKPDDRIVIYSQIAPWSSTRAWFMLSAFGATDVWILDGGFAKWTAEGRPTTAETAPAEPSDGSAFSLRDGFVYTLEQMHRVSAAITAGEAGHSIVDSRPQEAVDKETVVGATCVSTLDLFNEDHTLKSVEEVAPLFAHTEVASKPAELIHEDFEELLDEDVIVEAAHALAAPEPHGLQV